MSSNTETKDEIRRKVRAARQCLSNKDEASRRICERIFALPEYASAKVVMLYIDVRSEVRTTVLLNQALADEKVAAIPYCEGDELIAWRVNSREELTPGAFGILEPSEALRHLPDRVIDPQAIDLICVPGVAFDTAGNRLGSGRGFYDRLLPKLRPGSLKIGLAFPCQLLDQIPCEQHDVPMDVVITSE